MLVKEVHVGVEITITKEDEANIGMAYLEAVTDHDHMTGPELLEMAFRLRDAENLL
jgi:hypothetical protein